MGIQRVTDLIGDDYLNWKEGDQIIISTPTGSGKTTFIMRKLLLHACMQKKHIMYLCNRRALHDQSSSVLLFNIRIALQDDPELVDQLRVVFNAANESAEEIAARCARHFHVRTYQHCEKSGEYPDVDTKPINSTKVDPATTPNEHKATFQSKGPEVSTTKEILSPHSIQYYIFDEAHYFVCDAQINSGTKYWDEKLKYPEGISVFLTATPEPLLCYLNRSRLDLTSLSENLHESRFIESVEYYDWQSDKTIRDTTARKIAKEKARTAFCQFVEKSLDGTYENRFITYTEPTDYSYITPYYFNCYDDLFELIASSYNTTNEKWVIFVDSIRNGERLYLMLKYGIEALRKDPTNSNIAYLNATTVKSNEYNGKDIYDQIKDKQKFGCRILITTTFLDCGVNLIDSKLKNIVISNIDQTAFLQMLGRVRKTDLGINLYVQSFKISSILAHHNRYISALKNLSDLHLATHPVPDVENYNLENFDINVPGSLKGAKFPDRQLVSPSDARKANEQLSEDLAGAHFVDWRPTQKGKNYQYKPTVLIAGVLNVLYTIYCYRKALIANAQEKDPFAFLKIQLGWLGKTYDPSHWVNYDVAKNELRSYLGELADSECLLYPEHKAEFSERCLHYFMRFPLIPEAIKLDYSRYKFQTAFDSTDDDDETEVPDNGITAQESTPKKSCCGKDKLNGVFWSEGIAFEIRSVRKYPKTHPSGITCWKLVRLSEEEMSKKASSRLHSKAVQAAKRDETIERKKEEALNAKRKAHKEEQKKKNSFTLNLHKGDKIFATHHVQVDLNSDDIE